MNLQYCNAFKDHTKKTKSTRLPFHIRIEQFYQLGSCVFCRFKNIGQTDNPEVPNLSRKCQLHR